jgi:hypothetical protein
MPLNSSIIKKYLPALSSALSLLWSHRLGVAIRNPAGGGPAGVAARMVLVENNAAVVGAIRHPEARRMTADAGRARTSAVSGRVEAIVVVCWR